MNDNEVNRAVQGPPPDKPEIIGAITLTCPACAAELFGVTRVGDCSVCIACRALITLDVEMDWYYQADLNGIARLPRIVRAFLRFPTDAEETAWLNDPRVLNVINIVKRHHETHGSPHPRLNPGDDGRDEPWRRPGTPPY